MDAIRHQGNGLSKSMWLYSYIEVASGSYLFAAIAIASAWVSVLLPINPKS